MANHLQFNPITKDSYFYGKYRYCVAFTLDEASVLKSLDHDYIDAVLERRKLWREVAQQRWTAGKNNIKPLTQTILTKRWNEITDKTCDDLHNLTEILISTTIEFKLVTSVNQGWVYTNSTALIKKLNNLEYLKNKYCTEAIINRPKNTVKLKNPVHTHRSYFKSIKLNSSQKQNLINFFANQADQIRVGPAFNKWLIETPYLRLQDYFFIDHTGESWLVMLGLVYPGIIRKTMEIIPA